MNGKNLFKPKNFLSEKYIAFSSKNFYACSWIMQIENLQQQNLGFFFRRWIFQIRAVINPSRIYVRLNLVDLENDWNFFLWQICNKKFTLTFPQKLLSVWKLYISKFTTKSIKRLFKNVRRLFCFTHFVKMSFCLLAKLGA
jgi:hypothetical protein